MIQEAGKELRIGSAQKNSDESTIQNNSKLDETCMSDVELLQAHLCLSENKLKVKKIKSRRNSQIALEVLSEAKAS